MTQRSDFSALQTDQLIGGVSDSAALAHAPRSKRAVRIAVSLPVEIRDQFGGKDQPRTQFVMLRGCILTTTLAMRVGNKLTLQNLKNGRTAECHAIGVEPGLNGAHQVEIEFTAAQPEFWPVQFPAEDTRASAASSGPQTGSSQFRQASSVSDKDLVLLADSVMRDFTGTHPHSAERIATKVTTADSVAQFRAANRAAHKREQRRKAIYSAVFFAALSGAAVGARYWFAHKPQLLEATPAPELRRVAQRIAHAIPAKEAIAAQATAVETTDAAEPVTSSEPSASTRAVVAAPPSPPAANAQVTTLSDPPADLAPERESTDTISDTQVAVRHGSSYTAARKSKVDDPGEEPIALPLRVAETASAAKPEALKDVVTDVPAQTAVLAAQVPNKVVPAHLIRSVPAQYPPMARQLHVEGEVLLNVNVDSTGAVSSIKVVSGPPLLRAAATDCVKRWKYQPATLGDKPVDSTEIVKLDFHWR